MTTQNLINRINAVLYIKRKITPTHICQKAIIVSSPDQANEPINKMILKFFLKLGSNCQRKKSFSEVVNFKSTKYVHLYICSCTCAVLHLYIFTCTFVHVHLYTLVHLQTFVCTFCRLWFSLCSTVFLKAKPEKVTFCQYVLLRGILYLEYISYIFVDIGFLSPISHKVMHE